MIGDGSRVVCRKHQVNGILFVAGSRKYFVVFCFPPVGSVSDSLVLFVCPRLCFHCAARPLSLSWLVSPIAVFEPPGRDSLGLGAIRDVLRKRRGEYDRLLGNAA